MSTLTQECQLHHLGPRGAKSADVVLPMEDKLTSKPSLRCNTKAGGTTDNASLVTPSLADDISAAHLLEINGLRQAGRLSFRANYSPFPPRSPGFASIVRQT